MPLFEDVCSLLWQRRADGVPWVSSRTRPDNPYPGHQTLLTKIRGTIDFSRSLRPTRLISECHILASSNLCKNGQSHAEVWICHTQPKFGLELEIKLSHWISNI